MTLAVTICDYKDIFKTRLAASGCGQFCLLIMLIMLIVHFVKHVDDAHHEEHDSHHPGIEAEHIIIIKEQPDADGLIDQVLCQLA